VKTRRIVIAGLLVVALLVWALIPSVIQFIGQRELLRLQQRGAKVKVVNLTGQRVGLAAESVETWVPIQIAGTPNRTFPVSLILENARVNLSVPFFRPWSPGVRFSSAMYGGSVEGEVSDIGGSPLLTSSVQAVDLSLHPQMRALGVDSGSLTASTRDLPLTHTITTVGECAIELDRFAVSLPPMVRDIVKVESLRDGKLSLKASIQPSGRFSIKSGEFSSSLAQISLSGNGVARGLNTLEQASGTARITLLGEDGARLSQWLPLLTNQRVPASETSFSCAFELLPCTKLSGPDFRLGALCGKARCHT
jgi:hypothetical protein